MKASALILLFSASIAAAAPPTECQMKSAYVEFVLANRQDGLPESAIPDLYGDRLDRSWNSNARHAIYSDANLALSDPMRVAERIYQSCESERATDAARWRGAFSMPPSR